jgi:general secretion pathway protein L
LKRQFYVSNQSITSELDASERPIDLRDENTLKPLLSPATAGLLARADAYCPKENGLSARLVAAEQVGSFLVDVPRATARQRRALLTFAVEDRIAAPIQSVQVIQGPLENADPGQLLAFVLSQEIMTEIAAAEAPYLPEFLMIPRPDAGGGPAWSVWREGDRAVVRCSDGTGFALRTEMLPLFWSRSGHPKLYALAEPLGDALPAEDLSAAPPPPDPRDLAFSFARQRTTGAEGVAAWRWAAVAAGAALLIHLGLTAFDTAALKRIAQQERLAAEAAIANILPGVPLTGDVGPILARLTPAPSDEGRGPFLPLLNEVAGTLASDPASVGFRRLSWGRRDNSLVVLMQSPGLEDLQRIEQELETAGFAVRSGAATAGNGGAEVEMRITKGAGG